jgi:hypothetical protein
MAEKGNPGEIRTGVPDKQSRLRPTGSPSAPFRAAAPGYHYSRITSFH